MGTILVASLAVGHAAGAAKAVDTCSTVTPSDLQAAFGATYGAGTTLTSPGPTTNGLRALGFPETGCGFATAPGAVRPGLVVSTVAVDAVPGKAGAAAYKKAQKDNKGGSTALRGVGKKAFSVPAGPTGIEVYAWDKPGFVRVYAYADRYDTTSTKTSIVTPELTGQVAAAALASL